MIALVLAMLPSAWAQDPVPPVEVNAQLFQPAVDGSFFRLSDSSITADKSFVFRGTLDYSHNPLEYTNWDGSEDILVVGGVTQLDLGFGYALGKLRLGIDIPLLVHGGGDVGDIAVGIGQPYVDAKYQLANAEDGGWGGALGVRALVPNGGGPSPGLGGGPGASFELIGDRMVVGTWRLTGTAGALLQSQYQLAKTTWGSRLLLGLGSRVTVGPDIDLMAEFTTQPVIQAFSDVYARPTEILIGAQVPLGSEPVYAIRPGFSLGLGDAAGTPMYRMMLQFRRLPTTGPKDLDGDGLVDSEDACPEIPEDMDGWEDTDGCAEPTQVTVNVVDTDGMAVEDAEWTSGETSGKHGDTADFAGGDHSFKVGDVEVAATIAEGPPTTVTLEVPAPRGDLLVKVVDGDQKPVESAIWSATGPLDYTDQPANEAVATRPGSYELTATADGYRPGKGTVEVTESGEATLVLTLLPSKVELKAERIDIKDSVYFETAKAIIKEESFELLNEVAQIMVDHPELLLVRIEGHTDSRGNAAYNKDLSQRRAESVRTYLVEKGVAEDRLTAVGYGEEKPLEKAETPAAWEKNRRVDFFVEKRSDGDAPPAEGPKEGGGASRDDGAKPAEEGEAPSEGGGATRDK